MKRRSFMTTLLGAACALIPGLAAATPKNWWDKNPSAAFRHQHWEFLQKIDGCNVIGYGVQSLLDHLWEAYKTEGSFFVDSTLWVNLVNHKAIGAFEPTSTYDGALTGLMGTLATVPIFTEAHVHPEERIFGNQIISPVFNNLNQEKIGEGVWLLIHGDLKARVADHLARSRG